MVGEQLEEAQGRPGSSSADIVTRPRSSSDWVSVLTSPSCSSTCSIPEAIESPERFVSWPSTTRIPWSTESSGRSTSFIARALRGSSSRAASTLFAWRFDWMATRIGRSTASISYSIAARLRSEKETSRRVRSFTSCPEAARQWRLRSRIPARKSSLRSWWITSPRCTSSGSSSTWRRMILPSATLTIDWPSSAKPYPRSPYSSGKDS